MRFSIKLKIKIVLNHNQEKAKNALKITTRQGKIP